MKSFLWAVVALAACGGDAADQGLADGEVSETTEVSEVSEIGDVVEVREETAVDAEVAEAESRDGLDGTEVAPEIIEEVEVAEEAALEVDEEIAIEVMEEVEVVADVTMDAVEDAEAIDDAMHDAIDDGIDDTSGDTSMAEVPEPEVMDEVAQDIAQEIEVVVPPQIDVQPGCNTVFSEVPIEAAPHIPLCTATAFTTNPPTSGPHYPTWAAFKTYTNPVNPGFLVHSQEHGAVVIHHRCGDAPCDAELAQLATFIAGRAVDPMCVAPVANRIIVTPSVTIPSRFAVSAWGGMFTSDCFDFEALADFIDYYYAKAPENFCSPGADLDTIQAGSALYCPP